MSNANLPKSIQDIVELVGMAAAMALVKVYGGHPDLKIPLSAEGRTWSRLVHVMGPEAAEKFVTHYAGERLSVPKCDRALRQARDLQIIADYDGDASMGTLVERYQLTTRQIRTILKSSPGENAEGVALLKAKVADDNQMALF